LAAVGGAGYLSTLGSDTPSSIQVAQYAKVVQRKAVLRRLIGAAGKIAAIGYEDGSDVEEAIERSITELARVRLVDRAISKDFRLEKRGLGYLITWPDQQVELAFSRLKHRSSDVTADVLITCTLPGLGVKGSQLSMGRQNLSAPKGRMDFARTLQRRTHDDKAELIDWEDVIERSYVEILIAEARGEPIVDIDGWNDAPEFRAYALDPIAPRGEPTVLYAPGGTGKSYLSLALALSIQLGREIVPGIPPAMTGPVLYLDWETNAKTVKYRIRKIATGMGFDPPRIAYRRCTAPLADDAEQLSVEIAKRGTVLVVIDSAGAAIGSMGDYGDANEGALRFFEAIRALGSDLTVIVIDHVKKPVFTKRGGPAPSDGPYGSVYKVNAARSVWELREAARGEDDVTCSLRHAKVNDSKIYRPITYRLVWSPEGQAPETATFETADYVAEVGSRQGASVADRALEAIGSGRMSTSMIAQLLGASIDTVRRSLNRDSRFVRMGSDWLSAENAPMPMNQSGVEK
jgi:hypothetical protein